MLRLTTRRRFLELGVPLLGLGLADLLRWRTTAAESAPGAAGEERADDGSEARGRSLIVFWTHGGMSQQDTFDLKPNAPAEYRGVYRPIATAVPGVRITERFPRQA